MQLLSNGTFRVSVTFYDLHLKMFEQMQEQMGITDAEIIRRAVEFYYMTEFYENKRVK